MGFGAGAIEGGIHFDISEFAHGMLEAEAISSVFPPIVVEFLEHPLLAFAEVAKEALAKVSESIEHVALDFHQMGLEAMKVGVDTSTFSTLSAAAQAYGVNVEALGNAFTYMQDRAANALRGDESGIKAFNDLGISMKELAGMMDDPEKMFYRLSDAMHDLPDQPRRIQASMELMSREGKNILPFMQQGSAEIQKMAQQMGKLGAGVSEAEAQMGESWGRMEAEVSAAWKGIEKTLAEPFLEKFTNHLPAMEEGLGHFADYVRGGISAALTQMFDVIGENSGALNQFRIEIGKAFSDVSAELGPELKEIIKDLTQVAIDLLPAIPPLIRAIGEAASDAIGPIKYLVEFWKYLYDQNSPIHTVNEDFGPGVRMNAGILSEHTKQLYRSGELGRSHFTVNAPIKVDARETANQIAAKLQPNIQRGIVQAKQQIHNAVRLKLAARRNGGRG